jgi:shikimate dehydrogenase
MKQYGLLGKTLKHSFSRTYFENKFASEHITDCRYDNFELADIDSITQLIAATPDLRGFNITIPYKQEIISFLSQQSDVVKKTGACNCVKVKDEKLSGYNTDVIGFRKTLEAKLQPQHTQALILGSGGASRAVKYALDQLGINYLVVSRHKEFDKIGYEDLCEDTINRYKLIINTTPMGMFPNVDSDPPIPYEYLTSEHFLYDLVYNPSKTKFLEQGEQRGARTLNGYDMLVLQAEESWKIWNTD